MPAGKARNSCRLCVLLPRPEFKYRHMHISQNTPCLPPKKKYYLHSLCFSFVLGILQSPPEKLMAILMQNFVGGGGRRTRSINMGDVQIECIEDKLLVTTPPPEFQVTGGKTQHPKKSLGLPTKPQKISCRIKSPRHKNFQKAY